MYRSPLGVICLNIIRFDFISVISQISPTHDLSEVLIQLTTVNLSPTFQLDDLLSQFSTQIASFFFILFI